MFGPAADAKLPQPQSASQMLNQADVTHFGKELLVTGPVLAVIMPSALRHSGPPPNGTGRD